MMKVYGPVATRASIIQWYLEELGKTEYEAVSLNMKEGEHRKPEYLALNPMGKAPTLVEGDFKLWESGAILQYLSEKYDRKADQSPEGRALLAQWIIFANATLLPKIFTENSRAKETPRLFGPLNEIFQKQSFILGDTFSAADAALGSSLIFIKTYLKFDLKDYPAVDEYIGRMTERPAYKRTMGQKY